jgi:tetratricopeptide (TPR) repeat protein
VASAPAAAATAPAPGGVSAGAAPHIKEGDRAFTSKKYRDALFAYQDALQIDPRSVEALAKAGDSYAKLGYGDEAIDHWNRALALDPSYSAARDSLSAYQARRSGKAAEASAPPVAPAAAPGSAPPAAAPPAPVAAPQPVPAPAPAPAPPPAQAAPAPPPAQAAPSPAPAARAAPAQDPARAHYVSGVGLVRERKFAEAISEFDQALATHPGFAVALVARGSAKIGLGKYQDAIDDYTAARAADANLAAPIFGIAEGYRGLGQNDKAAEFYRAFAASSAPDAQAQLKQYALQYAQALAPQ